MIVAADGAVLRTGDGGRTWTTSPFRAPKDVTDLFLRDDDAWMVSASGAVIDTHDGGATWQAGALESDSGGPPALSLVRFADRDLGWIASGERLLRTTDGGATWSETLRLEEGLSFLTVESPDGRQVVAGVQGPCASYEQSGGGFRSEDGGATWEDVVDAEEAGADWEALVQDPSATAGLTRAVRTSGAEPGTKSFSAVEAWPEREGLHMRTIVVQERTCGDIEIGAGEEPPRPGWEVGDPCRLDPDRADEVLARFADRAPAADDALFVECGRERKTFHLPASIPRRRLARVSPSLVRLMEMADRMRPSSLRHLSVRQREEGATVVPLLRAGRFDAGMADPSALRALLDRYEGPLPPRGLAGSVEIDLPPDVSSRGVVPPRYPDIALMARVQGNVVLDLELDASGAVKEAEVASGIPLLDTAALQAARAWRFAPGASAAVPIRVRLRFGLDHCGRGGLIFDF
jgi:TonB family protein